MLPLFLSRAALRGGRNVNFLLLFILVFTSVNHLSSFLKSKDPPCGKVVKSIYWGPETLPKRASGEYWKNVMFSQHASTQCLYFSVWWNCLLWLFWETLICLIMSTASLNEYSSTINCTPYNHKSTNYSLPTYLHQIYPSSRVASIFPTYLGRSKEILGRSKETLLAGYTRCWQFK